MDSIIQIHQLTKNYYTKVETVEVLKGIDLTVQRGEILSIMGPSGVGKSTLLHIIGTLDTPTGGSVTVDRQAINFSDSGLSRFRSEKIGFVFQFHHLLPEFSALENVMMPAMILKGEIKAVDTPRAEELLRLVGLGNRTSHKPSELSGGELQRVAIARAFMNDPAIILADEPTGNLDSKAGMEIMELFHELHSRGRTIVMVTHESEIADETQRTITLYDGKISSDGRSAQ